MSTSSTTTLINDFLALVHPLFATVASSITGALRVVVRATLLLNIPSTARTPDHFVVFPDLLAGFLVDEDVAAVAVGPLGAPV